MQLLHLPHGPLPDSIFVLHAFDRAGASGNSSDGSMPTTGSSGSLISPVGTATLENTP